MMILWLQLVFALLYWSNTNASSATNSIQPHDYHFFRSDNEPRPALHDDGFVDPTHNFVTRNFISATLGDYMVLQRDKSAVIWGYSQPGARVYVSLFRDQTVNENASILPLPPSQRLLLAQLVTNVDDDGLWRINLPNQPASKIEHIIDVTAATGETGRLEHVLFGDVYICGGQSNMEFSFPGQVNSTLYVQEAITKYPHMRVMTIGCYTQSETPLPDLQKIESPWSLPTEDSMRADGPFGRFSAVCWFFGKEISKALDDKVPLGLINNNWGGSPIENWMDNGAYYNAMIRPYMVGPMALTGFTWYQGEANTLDQASADKYATDFPTMIQTWRHGFEIPDAYFGFVQLSTFCHDNPVGLAQFRQAQMSALELPGKIGYATFADHGAGCNIHPPDKTICGERLGRSALALQYGKPILWRSPTYANATTAGLTIYGNGTAAVHVVPSVVIEFRDVRYAGLYILENPYNNRLDPSLFNCTGHPEGTCAWSAVLLNNGQGWVNATLNIRDRNKVVMTASKTSLSSLSHDGGDTDVSQQILATSYGWGAVPMMQLYDAGTNLPVLAWNEKVDTRFLTG